MKRIVSLVTLFVVCAGLCAVAAAPARAYNRAAVEATVLRLINRQRTSRGLHAVRIQTKLDAAAFAHSRQMVSRDYFSHYSPGGATFAQRLCAGGYTRTGCRTWAVGEVIGWGAGVAGTAQAIVKAWMRSSSHRAVILDRRWRDVGVGCAWGTFCGIPGTLMCTVDFGRRAR